MKSSSFVLCVIVLLLAIVVVYGVERFRAHCEEQPERGVGCFLLGDHK